MLLILNLPLAPVFASVLRLRYAYIYPIVLGVSVIGVFAAHQRVFDMWLALGAAVLGYFMKRHGYPAAPVVLGLILGGLLEGELRRSLAMSGGSPAIFLERPVTLVLLLVAVGLGALAARRRNPTTLSDSSAPAGATRGES
jgi:putative tricarboxylic transport membrane protein